MRQLVSVVSDTHVAYFVQDGDDVRQIAHVVNPGFAVPEVIELGVQLQGALRINGTTIKRSPSPTALPAAQSTQTTQVPAPPERAAEASAQRAQTRTRQQQGQRGRVEWGLSQAKVLDDLRAHPGTTRTDIAERLTGSRASKAVGSVTTHVAALKIAGHDIVSTRTTGPDLNGRPTSIALLTLVEPNSTPDVDVPDVDDPTSNDTETTA